MGNDVSFRKDYKLNYGEIFIKDKGKEILISTYICHPSMANNELSGPCLSIYLSNWLRSKKLRYSYRFLFIRNNWCHKLYLSQLG